MLEQDEAPADDEQRDDVDFDTIMDSDGEEPEDKPAWARRRWSSAALVVAALVGAVVVALATWTWPETGPRGSFVADAELVGMTSNVGNAIATVSDQDGRLVLRIDALDVPDAADGYAQVWLADEDLQRLLAVGILDAEQVEYLLPGNLDLTTYRMVEITQERYDGDPSLRGRTLWSGELVGE